MLLTTVVTGLLLFFPHTSTALPAGFELDLKELKKPVSVLPPSSKRQTVAASKKTRNNKAAQTAAKKTASARTTQNSSADATSITKNQHLHLPPAEPAHATATAPHERTARLRNSTACELAQQLLAVLATPLPIEQALHGIAMPAVAAAQLHDITSVVACNLPAAEAYTFSRLLEADTVYLIHVSGNESPEQVFQTVTHQLGLTFYRRPGHPFSYLTTGPQGEPLVVQLENDVAP